ncbi:MAG: serine protease, partial [Mycobacterium sp.]
GTSGAPWISGSTVVGVIGGLHGGGCAENLSYSAPFDEHITELLARAEAGGPGDAPPAALDDDC